MQISRIRSYVGFAIKSGKAQFGLDNITAAKRKALVILFDSSFSERSAAKLSAYAERNGIDIFSADMEAILPQRNCKAIGIIDENLANAVKSELKEN